MIFTPLSILGAWRIDIERHSDDRGFFARVWCMQEFADRAIPPMVQASVSFNPVAGTVRGLHYARSPSNESKLVRCTRGRIHDVIVDLRAGSASFGQHVSVVLDEADGNALFVPTGVAHGFQTLTNGCEVHYMMTEAYRPELAAGVRYNDSAFGIEWPMAVTRISDLDRGHPDFDHARHLKLGQA